MHVVIRWLDPIVLPLAAGLFMLLFDWRRLLGYAITSGFVGYIVATIATVSWGVWVGIGTLFALAWNFGFRTLRKG